MYNILAYHNKYNKQIFIPEFTKYFEYLDDSTKKNLNYANIKKLVRSNLPKIKNSIFMFSVSKKGLFIVNFSDKVMNNLDSSILFKNNKIVIEYIQQSPFDRILQVILEMSGLEIIREKVTKISPDYTIALSNGKLAYKDDYGEKMIKEIEKTMQTFFKENCFNNLFGIRY